MIDTALTGQQSPPGNQIAKRKRKNQEQEVGINITIITTTSCGDYETTTPILNLALSLVDKPTV